MNKILSSIPKRDLIFICIIIGVMLAFIFTDTSVDILVNYDEEMLYVTSPRLNMDIPNSEVVAVELMEMPELGALLEGYQHEVYCTGVWENDIWGEYDLCVLPQLPKCIVITLTNERTCVFTCSNEAKTQELYTNYTAYLKEIQNG